MAEKIVAGMKAPTFDLPASTGGQIALKDFLGRKNVVLYFYPKDDTPGCTKEACGFRDTLDRFEALNTVVLGVSLDSQDSHAQFISKYQLTFPLLSDTDASVSTTYDVYKEKNMYGNKSMGIVRTTFVIDRDGIVRKIYPRVQVEEHARELLDYIAGNL